jgi:carbonic anhydrase
MRPPFTLLVLCVTACGGSAPPAIPPSAASAAPAMAAGAAPAAVHVAWSYSGEAGPPRWGDLEPSYVLCKSGKEQTPIDLSSKAEKGSALQGLAFQYPTIPLALFNNGHTVQVPNTGPATLTEGSRTWALSQFHLHAPSEHELDGRRFDAEVHFVHKNTRGELAVVGVFVQAGRENAALKAVFDRAPSDIGTDPRPVAGTTVDLKAILPPPGGYFTYGGSLTVPPCTEGVTWFVLSTPIEASAAQLARFHALTGGDTNRPLQPVGDRKVLRF